MSIAKGSMMQEPLLEKKAQLKASKTGVSYMSDSAKQDLESGESENFIGQAKTCWASMTRTNIVLFVVSPDNWAACAIILCWAYTIWTFWLDGLIGEPMDQNVFSGIYGQEDNVEVNSTTHESVTVVHHHWAGVFSAIACTIGLSIGVVYMLLKQQLLNQISQFRALNRQYDAQVKKLTQQADKLTSANDQLKMDLGKFKDVQDNIKAYSEKTGKDFSEIINKSVEVFDGISRVQGTEQRIHLQRCVADIRFLDRHGTEGVSEREFERLVTKIPAQYEAMRKQMNLTFEKVGKGKQEADSKDMNEFIEMLLEGVSQAPAS